MKWFMARPAPIIGSGHTRVKRRVGVFLCTIHIALASYGQVVQPVVAVHDSELTRALETMPAVAPTPIGPGTTGNQWWTLDWHYFVMPEAIQEALNDKIAAD